MEIQTTKQTLNEVIRRSETLKEQCSAMVLLAPQILDEEDVRELRSQFDTLATNFSTCASFLYNFGRMSPSSRKYAPMTRIDYHEDL